MANVSVFDVGGGIAVLCPTGDIAAAAAEQAVPCRKDARLCLRVCNANAETDVVVRILAGDGPRAVLGHKDVTVGAGNTAYIALFDTARFKRLNSAAVHVALVDADGDALGAPVLSSMAIEAIQM